MSTVSQSIEEQRRKGFRHASDQKGWTNASYRPSRTLEEANYLGDEEYHDRLGVHNPLWRYIISRYVEEWDTPIIVMGFEALPLAIELSQWTYPVSLVVRDEDEMKQANSDAKRQAGTFQIVTDELERCPRSRIAIFIGLLDELPEDRIKDFIDYLLKGVREVVCAVRKKRDYKKIFGKNLVYTMRYNNNNWRLLRFN